MITELYITIPVFLRGGAITSAALRRQRSERFSQARKLRGKFAKSWKIRGIGAKTGWRDVLSAGHSTLDTSTPTHSHHKMAYSRLWLGLLGLLVAVHCAQGLVMGIDLGSQWYKLAMVRPGRPIDIVLNEQSSRKTHTMVGWNKEERAFGSDAFNLVFLFVN